MLAASPKIGSSLPNPTPGPIQVQTQGRLSDLRRRTVESLEDLRVSGKGLRYLLDVSRSRPGRHEFAKGERVAWPD